MTGNDCDHSILHHSGVVDYDCDELLFYPKPNELPIYINTSKRHKPRGIPVTGTPVTDRAMQMKLSLNLPLAASASSLAACS